MRSLALFILGLVPMLLIGQTSIYEIQYTTIAGDGSYPSPYEGQTVTTGGIVTVTDFNGGRYFISSSEGGPWNGLFIYDNNYAPNVGDSILITGLVYEYNGMTEIKDLTAFSVISSSNPLPDYAQISTSEVWDEAYEGVLAEVSNCEMSSEYDEYANFWVNDGSGECAVRPGRYSLQEDGFPAIESYPFNSLRGIITDYYGPCLLPGGPDDLQSAPGAFSLSTEERLVDEEAPFEIPVRIGLLNQTEDLNSFQLDLSYDASILSFEGYEIEGTLSETGSITDQSSTGNISLTYSGGVEFSGMGPLIKLVFTPVGNGNSNLQFTSASINGNTVDYMQTAELVSSVGGCMTPQADTLSVVQRPLMNIPSIVTPGELLTIECFAPENTTGWEARLLYEDYTTDLSIESSEYNAYLDKWTLEARVSDPNFYELYDLELTASGGIYDHVTNAVKVIESYKDDYYFIQITDTHLPGKTYYGDPGYETDDSEMDDLEEVIEDINLLRPEFVLLTGDLLNEGEMEDFECLRHHTKTVELLEKFEVPVYVVPGNHDLGGWDPTPPPQGTARRDWWKFFGWGQRNIPPEREEYYVHDYSFDYGDVHYVGLESSDNYDQYMYDVYGDRGFIPSQLEWLEDDLEAAGNKTKALFYHFDFNNDINLNALGADMALWGHQHSNTNDFSHPYDIGTDNVCNNTGAYRVIRVSDSELTPEYTSYTGSGGQNLAIDFSDENNGSSDSLVATITNNQNQAFADAVVKFVMPANNHQYTATNGNMLQVSTKNGKDVCYVNVVLQANSETTVTVKQGENLQSVEPVVSGNHPVKCFPNPFEKSTIISYQLKREAQVSLEIYSMEGRLVKVLANKIQEKGTHQVKWQGKNKSGHRVRNGIYFYRFNVNGKSVGVNKIMVMR